MTKEEALDRAIRNGEIIRIRYFGGHSPGTVREISPRSLRNGHVYANDVAADAFKCFILERLEIVSADEPITYRPDADGEAA